MMPKNPRRDVFMLPPLLRAHHVTEPVDATGTGLCLSEGGATRHTCCCLRLPALRERRRRWSHIHRGHVGETTLATKPLGWRLAHAHRQPCQRARCLDDGGE